MALIDPRTGLPINPSNAPLGAFQAQGVQTPGAMTGGVSAIPTSYSSPGMMPGAQGIPGAVQGNPYLPRATPQGINPSAAGNYTAGQPQQPSPFGPPTAGAARQPVVGAALAPAMAAANAPAPAVSGQPQPANDRNKWMAMLQGFASMTDAAGQRGSTPLGALTKGLAAGAGMQEQLRARDANLALQQEDRELKREALDIKRQAAGVKNYSKTYTAEGPDGKFHTFGIDPRFPNEPQDLGIARPSAMDNFIGNLGAREDMKVQGEIRAADVQRKKDLQADYAPRRDSALEAADVQGTLSDVAADIESGRVQTGPLDAKVDNIKQWAADLGAEGAVSDFLGSMNIQLGSKDLPAAERAQYTESVLALDALATVGSKLGKISNDDRKFIEAQVSFLRRNKGGAKTVLKRIQTQVNTRIDDWAGDFNRNRKDLLNPDGDRMRMARRMGNTRFNTKVMNKEEKARYREILSEVMADPTLLQKPEYLTSISDGDGEFMSHAVTLKVQEEIERANKEAAKDPK